MCDNTALSCHRPPVILFEHPCHPCLIGGGSVGAAPPMPIIHDDASSDSDNESPGLFVEAEWIGCGRTWDTSLPKHVMEAFSQARSIPDGVCDALIPPSHLMVNQALSEEWLTPEPTSPLISVPTYCLGMLKIPLCSSWGKVSLSSDFMLH